MTALFTNPTGAYGQPAFSGDTSSKDVKYFQVAGSTSAATTVSVGQVVGINATGQVVVAAAETAVVVGVALETVTVPDTDSTSYLGPKTIAVCTGGLCEALSNGVSATLGAALYATTGGKVASGTATAGDFTVGFAVEDTGTTDGALVTIYVSPEKQNP